MKRKQRVHSLENETKKANEEAQRLIGRIKKSEGDLTSVYSSLQNAIEDYEISGGKVEELIPTPLGGTGVGWSLYRKGKKGEGFWIAFLTGIRNDMCEKDGYLRQIFKDGIHTSASVIAMSNTQFHDYYGLPLTFAAKCTALLLSKGIDKWCKSLENGQ
jgi:hypothetical protein